MGNSSKRQWPRKRYGTSARSRLTRFRIGTGSPANLTNSFVELYNAGSSTIDISNWTMTEHPTQQPIFSSVKVPAGTKLAAGGFYVLGLSNSGLAAAPARRSDATISVRSTTGMNAGDTISVDTGSNAETRKIVSVGTAAGNSTTLWEPLPDGPELTIPARATSVPVTSVAGFTVGEKIAIGYGAGSYPTVAAATERCTEVATVTAIGKQGTQAYLGADAAAGSTNIKVTSVANISAGDKIRLDIDSVGHGIETVTVTHVGTQTSRAALAANASAGATNIKVRNVNGLAVGDKVIVGAAAETVTITAVGTAGPSGTGVDFAPALAQAHSNGDAVLAPGTGLELAAPLKFNHAANLPFSDRGTGISFTPATAFAHVSNEPVQPLGTGITLDSPLAHDHRDRRGCARRQSYDCGLPSEVGTQSVVRRTGPLAQRRQHGAARCRGIGRRQPELWTAGRPLGRRGVPGCLRITAEWLPCQCTRSRKKRGPLPGRPRHG